MYLGVDLGTSSVKLVLIDDKQTVIAKASSPLTVDNPYPLWSEQNPENWWQAFIKALRVLKKEKPSAIKRLQAIGLSGQQHGATLLNKRGDVLRPAILWNDGRSFLECAKIESKVPDFEKITGNRIMPGFTAPKLLWVREHEPKVFDSIAKVLLPKDYLRYRLSGDYASDLSDSAGTGWLNTGKRTWSKTMLSATYLNETQMPTLFEGSTFSSTLSPTIAKELGLPLGIKIAAGAGDNAASAISMNVIANGKGFLSLGTSGVYFVSADQYRYNAAEGVHSFCHAIPDYWHHMAVHLSSACCLDWWSEVSHTPITSLVEKAKRRRKNHSTPLFLPYLSGERTPHNDPHARGVFIGMNRNSTNADMSQAILEGVVLAFMSGQSAILNAGIAIDEVSVVGGGARIPYWGKLLASGLSRPLIYRKNREVGAALGAALLAWVADQGQEAIHHIKSPEIDEVVKPVAALNNYFTERYPLFIKAYHQLKPIFSQLRT